MIHSYILQEKTKDDDTKILAVKYPCNWVSDLGIHLDTQVVDIMTSLNFRDVYYCPGNHELWTRSGREDEELHIDNSIEKFQY
ncbi:unnamed protein product [Rotaria socialis]|uniref:Uncharacterized protein n=1 Tax=Rotaria socialis TaxID=392032 RepID=A0A817T503_9BILA|nr:unnamed protein product [Rotaria socialis]CAF3312080.1 unnamed protein product [Rotaria socialis]